MAPIRPDNRVVGEGEFIFTQLLDAYLGHRDKASVKGIWHWKSGVPAWTGERDVAANLDDLPHPDMAE